MKVIKYDLTSSDSFRGQNYDLKQHSSLSLQSTDAIPEIHVSTVIRIQDKAYTAQKLPKVSCDILLCKEMADSCPVWPESCRLC